MLDTSPNGDNDKRRDEKYRGYTPSCNILQHMKYLRSKIAAVVANSWSLRGPGIDDYDRAVQGKEQPPAGKRKLGINDRLTSYLP